MPGQINWGVIDPSVPMKVAESVNQGMEDYRSNALKQLAAEKAMRDIEDEQAVRQAYRSSGGDMNALKSMLYGQGLYKQGNDVASQMLAQREKESVIGKNTAQAAKSDHEVALGRLKWIQSSLANIGTNPTPETAYAVMQEGVRSGILPKEKATEEFYAMQDHPGGIAGYVQQKTGEISRPAPKEVNLGNRVSMVDMNPLSKTFGQEIGSQRIGMSPGESARLAQSERHFQATQAQPVFSESAGGFIQKPNAQNPNGAVIPVPGLQNNKPLTEFQGKSTGFASRAKASSDIIDTIGKDGEVQPGYIKRMAESLPLVGGAAGTLANVTQSTKQQQVEQAQRDFVNAILRQESGAAISPSEFDNAIKQYFPQPGDSKPVIEQKRQNRNMAIRGLEVSAGPGIARMGGQQNQAESGGLTPDEQKELEALRARLKGK